MHPKVLLSILIVAMTASVVRSDDVFINEIMYHPATENPLEEYIELCNKGAITIDVTGWRFKRGINFDFPNAAIEIGRAHV